MESKNPTKKYGIMFAGASGIGKTTSAKLTSESLGIDFVSGSVSDLLPKTKEMSHKDMLSRDPKELAMEDFQILNLRHKLFRQHENFISDRSYLDSAAYFIYKQADKLPQCEVEHFLEQCKMLLTQECTHLIFFDYTQHTLKQWLIEDNGKRITSGYFQMEISCIMQMVLDIWGAKFDKEFEYVPSGGRWFNDRKVLKEGASIWNLDTIHGSTRILIMREMNLDIRSSIINKFLKS